MGNASNEQRAKRRTSDRLTVIMPWKPGWFGRENTPNIKDTRERKRSYDHLGTTTSPPKAVGPISGSIISETPKNRRWDAGSTRCPKSPLLDVLVPSSSAVDTVFEVAEAELPQSPKSPLSALIAELEDTSPVQVQPKKSAFAGSQLALQSSSFASRSAIKLIDQTIAAIEADNRRLLSRAITAEQSVSALRERNAELQKKIDRINKRPHRPRASASQPMLRKSHSVADSDPTNTPGVRTSPSNQALNKSTASKSSSPVIVSPVSLQSPFSPSHPIHAKPLPSPPRPSRPPTEIPLRKPQSSIHVSQRKSRPTHTLTPSSLNDPAASSAETCSQVDLFSLQGLVRPQITEKSEVGSGTDGQELKELEGDLGSEEHEPITGLPKVVEMEQKKWV